MLILHCPSIAASVSHSTQIFEVQITDLFPQILQQHSPFVALQKVPVPPSIPRAIPHTKEVIEHSLSLHHIAWTESVYLSIPKQVTLKRALPPIHHREGHHIRFCTLDRDGRSITSFGERRLTHRFGVMVEQSAINIRY